MKKVLVIGMIAVAVMAQAAPVVLPEASVPSRSPARVWRGDLDNAATLNAIGMLASNVVSLPHFTETANLRRIVVQLVVDVGANGQMVTHVNAAAWTNAPALMLSRPRPALKAPAKK